MAGSSSSCLQRETRCLPSVSPALNSGPSYPRLSILRTVNIVFPSAFHLLTYTLSASHFINGVQLLSRKASLFLRRRKVVLARYWRSALYSSPLPPGLYMFSSVPYPLKNATDISRCSTSSPTSATRKMAKSGLISLFRLSSGLRNNALCTLAATIPGISLITGIPSEYITTPLRTVSAACCSSADEPPCVSSTTPSASVAAIISVIPVRWFSSLVLLSHGLYDMKNRPSFSLTCVPISLSPARPPGRSRYRSHWFLSSRPRRGQVGHIA